jgi:hypothetical protein
LQCSIAKKYKAEWFGDTFSGFSKLQSNHCRDNEYQSIYIKTLAGVRAVLHRTRTTTRIVICKTL